MKSLRIATLFAAGLVLAACVAGALARIASDVASGGGAGWWIWGAVFVGAHFLLTRKK